MTTLVKPIRLFKNCDELPIYYFFKLQQESDLSALIKEVEEYEDKEIEKYVEKHTSELIKLKNDIGFEFQKLKFGKKELRRMKEEAKIIYLHTKLNAVEMIIDSFKHTESVELLELVNEFEGFAFDKEKKWSNQVSEINRKLKYLRNEIKIKSANYKKKYNLSIDDQVDESLLKKLDQQAIGIEKGLELGYKIDVKKTSVIRWLNLVELSETQLNRLKNGKGSNNNARGNK